MAQSFDTSKATSDLKQLLNLSLLKSQNDASSVGGDDSTNTHSNTVLSKNTESPKDSKSQKDCKRQLNITDSELVPANSNQNALSPEGKSDTHNTSPSKQKSKSNSVPVIGDKSQKKKNVSEKRKTKDQSKSSNTANGSNTQEQKNNKEKGLASNSYSKTQVNFKLISAEPSDRNLPSKMDNSEGSSSSLSTKDTPVRRETTMDKSKLQQKRTNEKSDKNENSASDTVKNNWDNLSRELQLKLDENKIFFLKKKNMRFPNAKYYCRLCDYHMDSVDICEKHVYDGRHSHRKEVNSIDSTLRNMPHPLPNHIEAVTKAVEQIYEEHGLKPADRELRKTIVERLEERLKEKFPDVKLHMYGTSLTCMGLKTSDINVNLYSSEKDKKLTSLLNDSYLLMRDRTETGFINVHSDFTATVPALLLTDAETGLKLTVTIHFYSALCTSELLAIYSDFDDRVMKLTSVFRYWAHLCGVDKHQVGFFPPIALNIMVVFFLQTIKPQLLPIINPPAICGEDTGDFSQDKAVFQLKRNKTMKTKPDLVNKMSVGELWVGLVKFYSIELDIPNTVISIRSPNPISRSMKPWNSKKLAVEDPFMTKKNLTRMVSHSYEFWQYAIKKVYHFFGLPRGADGSSHLPNYDFPEDDEQEDKKLAQNKAPGKKTVADNKEGKPSSSNEEEKKASGSKQDSDQSNVKQDPSVTKNEKDSPQEDMKENNVSTAQGNVESDTVTKDEKDSLQEETKENDLNEELITEFDTKINLSDTVTKDETTKDKVESDAKSSPADTPATGDDSSAVSVNDETIPKDQVTLDNSAPQTFILDYVNSIVEKAVDLVQETPLSDTDSTSQQRKEEKNYESAGISACSEDLKSKIKPSPEIGDSKDVKEKDDSSKPTENCSPAKEKSDDGKKKYSFIGQLASKACVFEFTRANFINKKEPTIICTSCEKEGHHRNECPEDELPEILPIPGFTERHRMALEDALQKMPSAVGLSDRSIMQRQMFLQCLEGFIQNTFPGARLQLFGSSCNGFGFDRSDMDICMTFIKKRQNIDKVRSVEKLASILKMHRDLKNVQAIPTAKVPIVKFTIASSDLDGDISLYNTLAQENTRLLQCYSRIDPRVRVLGYTIKIFSQVCDIGDASRGSLSSYGYVLMMLYYLQQVSPPVIPVLQELHPGTERPKNIVEGWNAWFMDNLDNLRSEWPEFGKNKQSVSELWLGFLRFYVEEFNYKELVISIRQKEPLTRFEKLWNGFCLAIEDPFDLNHNLGSGLSQTMNTFILKTFINGRMLYGSPIDDNMELFNKYQSPSDYFFDAELLSEARPPNSRGCRNCGKIGHLMRHCPQNKKERDDEYKNFQRHQPRHFQDQQRYHQGQPRYPHGQQRHPQGQQRHPQGQHRHPYQDQQQRHFPDQQRQHSKQQSHPHQSSHPQQPQQPPAHLQQAPHPQQANSRNQQQLHDQDPRCHQSQQPNNTPQQQQHRPIKTMSFQHQKQQEAQQLHRQMEREWLAEKRKDKKPPPPGFQELQSSGPSHSYPHSYSNLADNPALRASTPRGLNPRHPSGMAHPPPLFPPSLLPPPHRQRGPSGNHHGPYGGGNPGSFRQNYAGYNNSSNNSVNYYPSPGHPSNMPPQHDMSPMVQNLFASAQGQVLDARAMHPPHHRMKKN